MQTSVAGNLYQAIRLCAEGAWTEEQDYNSV